MAGNAALPSTVVECARTSPLPRFARVTLAPLPPVRSRGFCSSSSPARKSRLSFGVSAAVLIYQIVQALLRSCFDLFALFFDSSGKFLCLRSRSFHGMCPKRVDICLEIFNSGDDFVEWCVLNRAHKVAHLKHLNAHLLR